MTDYLVKFISWPFSAFFSQVRVNIVSSNVVIYCFSAILIVFAYGFVELSFAGDEVSELSGKTVDSGNRGVKPMKLFYIPLLVDGIKANEFIKNSGTELRSSPFAFGEVDVFFDSVDCKPVFDEKTNEIPSPTAKNGEGKISYIFKQLFHDHVVIFTLGFLAAFVISLFVFDIYPKRLAKRNGFYYGFAPNAKGNQRRPLNLGAISATLLPAVWLTQLLCNFIYFNQLCSF